MSKSPIVARINSLLAEKGISKQEFYDACHITSATYSLWNTGKTTPRMKNLENISVYLHTTTDYLLTGLGEKETPPTPEGEGLDPLDMEALSLLRQLRPENQKQVFDFAQALLKIQESAGGQSQKDF